MVSDHDDDGDDNDDNGHNRGDDDGISCYIS
jgi:hypothetical protein